MKRKLISLLTATVCAFSVFSAFCACGSNKGNGGNGGDGGNGDDGGNGGITETTDIYSIVSEKIEDANAWKAAFELGDVNLSSLYVSKQYEDGVQTFHGIAKYDYYDNKAYTHMDTGSSQLEQYCYLDGSTIYSLRYYESLSKWVRSSKERDETKEFGIHAYIFDPIYKYCYSLDYNERFYEFTYSEDKNGYVFTYKPDQSTKSKECVVKFYDGKLAALIYTETNDGQAALIDELMVYNMGGSKTVNVPTDFVDKGDIEDNGNV